MNLEWLLGIIGAGALVFFGYGKYKEKQGKDQAEYDRAKEELEQTQEEASQERERIEQETEEEKDEARKDIEEQSDSDLTSDANERFN